MASRSKPKVESAKPVAVKKSGKGKTAGKRSGAARLAMVCEEEAFEWVCGWEFELAARASGSMWIAGVDEVGRGPLFGPVVAAAVILPEGAELDGLQLDGLNDSKKLSEEERELFNERVREIALAYAVAEVDVRTIDRINILQASRLAMRLAVEALGQQPDHLLIDGNQKIDYCPPGAVCRQTTIVQGDARSLSIAAASVIAKVHRDRLLCELDAVFPGYGLARNKGYGTPEHKEALLRLGITEMHRRSFSPVAELFEVEVEGIEVEVGLFEE
ncbi:MAG TPA: ribonuclease HII [Acidobacteriaceae bacterium]|jgi:ribonuclease HII|nr:ribonuclease HII [Acidobacteriaceae bacterium]